MDLRIAEISPDTAAILCKSTDGGKWSQRLSLLSRALGDLRTIAGGVDTAAFGDDNVREAILVVKTALKSRVRVPNCAGDEDDTASSGAKDAFVTSYGLPLLAEDTLQKFSSTLTDIDADPTGGVESLTAKTASWDAGASAALNSFLFAAGVDVDWLLLCKTAPVGMQFSIAMSQLRSEAEPFFLDVERSKLYQVDMSW